MAVGPVDEAMTPTFRSAWTRPLATSAVSRANERRRASMQTPVRAKWRSAHYNEPPCSRLPIVRPPPSDRHDCPLRLGDVFGLSCVAIGASYFIADKGAIFSNFPMSTAEAVACTAGGVVVMFWSVAASCARSPSRHRKCRPSSKATCASSIRTSCRPNPIRTDPASDRQQPRRQFAIAGVVDDVLTYQAA